VNKPQQKKTKRAPTLLQSAFSSFSPFSKVLNLQVDDCLSEATFRKKFAPLFKLFLTTTTVARKKKGGVKNNFKL